jgi:hypothetical protein
MRAILIDSVARTITETEHIGDDWRDICCVLGCKSMESAGVINGDIFEDWHGLLVDAHSLLDEEHPC